MPRTATSSRAPTELWRRTRLALVAVALLGAALLAGYFLWLRDSSLVRVEEVVVTGLTAPGAEGIRTTLEESARGMSTLNVDEEALERVVASEPAVEGLEVTPDVPHKLTIEVIERRPIATVEGPDGGDLPVAADGTLLPGFEVDGSLAHLPASVPSTNGQLDDEMGLATLAAVDAAPPALLGSIETVERAGEEGLVAALESGLVVVLGDQSRLDAKWAAAAAVIAEGEAADAGYIDVSLPERPAAGG